MPVVPHLPVLDGLARLIAALVAIRRGACPRGAGLGVLHEVVEDPVGLVVPNVRGIADAPEVLDGIIIEIQIVLHDRPPVLEVRPGLEGHPLWRVICQ